MTREDAIKNLNMISVAFVDPVTREQRKLINDTFDMAIQALSQEPCTDAVSREAVIKLFRGNIGSEVALILHRVKQLPSVTQKSGKWIEHPEIETTTPEYLMFYECSECGDKPCFCKSDIHKKRFCSNCGAKMVEPQERSDKE